MLDIEKEIHKDVVEESETRLKSKALMRSISGLSYLEGRVPRGYLPYISVDAIPGPKLVFQLTLTSSRDSVQTCRRAGSAVQGLVPQQNGPHFIVKLVRAN